MLTRNMAVRAGVLLAALAPAPAFAATASSTLNVDATVTANCTVSTSALSFGNVDPLGGSDVDASGGITVTCTNGTDWSAAAGIGSGSGASYAARRMSAGADLLAYNIYTDAGRTSVWGDGTGATDTIDSTGTGAVQNVTVYGRVPSGQTSVPPGGYSDTVAVTVTYN